MRENSKVSVASTGSAVSAPSYFAMRTARAVGGAPANAAARASKRGGGQRKTVRLSQILRQVPSSVEANKISVVEKYVTEVDELPDRFLDVEVLFLSHNSICTLAGFLQFRQLRVLSLACNCIETFMEIESIGQLSSLQVLNLEGNPVTIWPFYRLHTIDRLPKLKMLDSKEVKGAERDSAPGILKEEGEMLQLMFSNHFLQKKLEGAMTRIRLHSELMAVTYGRTSALNRADLPTPTSLDTRKYLESWDLESNLGPKERDRVLAELRLEVRRVKLSQGAKDMDVSGVFDVFKVLVSEGEDPSTALKRRPGMTEHAQWELAFKQVSMAQQTNISRLLSRLQDVKAEAEAKTAALYNQSSAISQLRAENDERERNAHLDREALIRELRAQVGSLEAASGLSIQTLSPVNNPPSRTPAFGKALGPKAGAEGRAARRLPMSMPQAHGSGEQQRLRDIAAAPRTDGRRLPSGRQAGSTADATVAASLAGGGEGMHMSFELPDDKMLRGDLRGDVAPFIATKCSPAGAAATATPAHALAANPAEWGEAGVGTAPAAGSDDVEVPAPRLPPQPMAQAGSAFPSPVKAAGASSRGGGDVVSPAVRAVRDSMSKQSAGLLGEAASGVGVWEGGWGVGGAAGRGDDRDELQEDEEQAAARLSELARTARRLVMMRVSPRECVFVCVCLWLQEPTDEMPRARICNRVRSSGVCVGVAVAVAVWVCGYA